MKNILVAKAFAERRAASGSNLWTDGKTIWSYSTRIAHHAGYITWLNTRKYSVSTSRHQSYVRYQIPAGNVMEYEGEEAKMWRSWRDGDGIRRAHP